MEYNYKKYEILTNKQIDETKIVTISDLNWNQDTTRSDINDLIVSIYDMLPKYIFILGNVCTYNNLEDTYFNEKITYFYKLLSCIGKSFIVFGNHDYITDENQKGFYTNIDSLFAYYNKAIPYYINNNLATDDNFNIVGFNKSHISYNSIETAKTEILNLVNKISNVLDKDKYNILITHYELEQLKLEKELLETFDLILTGTNHKIIKKKLFNFKNNDNSDIINDDKRIIKTNGVCQGEINFIKIKHK